MRVELFCLANAIAKECAIILIEEVSMRYNLPRSVISDNCFQFVSTMLQQIFYLLNIKQSGTCLNLVGLGNFSCACPTMNLTLDQLHPSIDRDDPENQRTRRNRVLMPEVLNQVPAKGYLTLMKPDASNLHFGQPVYRRKLDKG
ncbi:hypothetical protein CDAR_283261 [Caerostris darwini]|uniref:Integrase catalytic domain-containing protein n=1 Tax=Caerostris darwini TaxID=1538125 RepID=A0AAV4TET8_9ARAC|nr:hypothetical protein CDAR_283261 [Caerostris darwini]